MEKGCVDLVWPNESAKFKAAEVTEIKANKNFQKLILRDSKTIVKQSGKHALLGAKKAAQAARILGAAATIGMYTGIAGGIIGGVVAYTTIPEVEAGMRKAVAGVRVAAGETYKMVKEETNEIIESCYAFR